MKIEDVLTTPIVPVSINKDGNVRDTLLAMSKASFQGRKLGEALEVWEEMIESGCYVFMGLAGALVPAGMRGVIDWLIREGKIHCLVSTGANLFHELHESIGYRHYKGNPQMSDTELRKLKIDRIYDTLADDEEFVESDRVIVDFVQTSFDKEESITTAVFFHRLGKYLKEKGKGGFLVSAYEMDVPVYCPAIGDSSYGIALASFSDDEIIHFNIIQDVRDLGKYILDKPRTGVIYIGGGTPKNYIQQAELVAFEYLREREGKNWDEADKKAGGHHFAIQISTDAPHWGGLSGCSLEEGQSWGKERMDAKMVNLYCDATIALPLLANALAQRPKVNPEP